MHLPDPDSLRCFLAAAKHLNFREAANEVSLTAAALGQRIKALEDLFGAQLFLRSTRSVELSEFGALLLPHAQKAIEALTQCLQPSQSQNILLRIGTEFELGITWLQPALNIVREQSHDEFNFQLSFGDGSSLLGRLMYRHLDIILHSTPTGEPNLAFEPLHDADYSLVCSPELIKAKPLKNKTDASHHILIDESPRLTLFGYWVNAHQGFIDAHNFKSQSYLGTTTAIRNDILAGYGVAVLPNYFIQTDLDEGRLVNVFPRRKLATDSLGFVYLKQNLHIPLIRRLTDELRKFPLK